MILFYLFFDRKKKNSNSLDSEQSHVSIRSDIVCAYPLLMFIFNLNFILQFLYFVTKCVTV